MLISNKTLIIRLSSIGDIVLGSPLIRVLRKRFPSSQIDFVVRKEYSELVRYNPNLNFIHEFNSDGGFRELRKLAGKLRSESYDLVIDIHNSLRSRYLRSFIRAKKVVVIDKRIFARTMLVRFKKNYYRNIISVADRYIEPVKSYRIENDGGGLEIFIPDETAARITEKVSSLKSRSFGKIVGLCPSAKHATKRWPEERFIEAGIILSRELNAKIVIFGGNNDAELCARISHGIKSKAGDECAIDYSSQFSLLETAAAMDFCDIIVTNDSGLMHIAAARCKKIVAIFGSTVREFGFYPVGTENIVIERNGLYCRPCSHIGLDSCPERHFRCMNDIVTDDVVGAVKAIDTGTKTY